MKASPNAALFPNSLTNGTAKSAERVSLQGVAPSPWIDGIDEARFDTELL